ncbi:MAG: hypothetical protein GY856_38230 [bacterium]|nr:hypothetical protein [bacterium]
MNTLSDDRFRRLTRSRWGPGIASLLLLSGVCPPYPTAVATTLTRGPYLQLATTTGAWVHWSTSDPAESWVLYGDAPDQLTQTVSDPVPKTVHRLRIQGLQANTRYYYAVGTSATTLLAGGDPEHFLSTPPPAGAAASTRIWVIGDSGTADANADAVRDGYLLFTGSQPTDVWLNASP